jgi:putative addiction module killer protein
MEYTIKIYRTSTGKKPFSDWLHTISDTGFKAAIHVRLERLKMGNFGVTESVGNGCYELKFDIGPGFRIYFVKIGLTIVLILCAGNKKKQSKDINNAKIYAIDYQKRTEEGNYD